MFGSIKKWIAEKGVRSVVPSVVRLALGALAGYLASQGYSDAAEAVTGSIPGAVEVVSAVVVAVFAILWSLLEKAKTVPTTPKPVAQSRGVDYAK